MTRRWFRIIAFSGGLALRSRGPAALLSALAVDLLVFLVALALGAAPILAQGLAFVVGAVTFLSVWRPVRRAATAWKPQWVGHAALVVAMAGLVRTTWAVMVRDALHGPTAILWLMAAAVGALFLALGAMALLQSTAPVSRPGRLVMLALYGVAFAIAMRIGLLAILDLMPEEAYYWLYAQNLDWGYLDHPPMVAWMIALSTSILGSTEVGVRVPALLCSVVMAGFMVQFARAQYGQRTALLTLLFVVALPYFYIQGSTMFPDAPLGMFWAGYLFFAYRAMVQGRRGAWLGMGICMGLGMLSKYTIVLLGGATGLFLLVDADRRKLLLRPDPYLAGILSVLIFSPVLIWNGLNEWVSFAFQGSSRWSFGSRIHIHELLGMLLLVITPVGALAAVQAIWAQRRPMDPAASARRAFTLIFTLAPLSVFVVHSIQHAPKVNWTGPIWLGILPLLAHHSLRLAARRARPATDPIPAADTVAPRPGLVRHLAVTPQLWAYTCLATLTILGGLFTYLAMGIPGAPPMRKLNVVPVAWEEMGHAVDEIEAAAALGAHNDNHELWILGLDKNFISSEMAFYDFDRARPPDDITGRHLFGNDSLMFALWHPAAEFSGRDILMLSFKASDLKDQKLLGTYFDRLGPVLQRDIQKNGQTISTLHYQIGHGYRVPVAALPGSGIPPVTAEPNVLPKAGI